MKKIIIVLAGVALLFGGSYFMLLELNRGEEPVQEESRVPEENQEEITRLVMAVPYSDISEEDMSLMEREVNAITREKIGVEVSFVRADHYRKTITLMLAGEEQLDIMMASGNMFIETYINEKLMALDDLLEQYGRGILEEVGETAVQSCSINGKIYGVPNNRDYAAGTNAFMLRKDILDQYGINSADIKTVEQLEEVFAFIKEKEPDMTVLASGGGTMISNLYFTSLMMGSFRPGVHMDYGREEEIVNLFETEEYFEALKRVRRWYLQGYLDADLLGQTESLFSRVRKGEIFAYTTKWKPGLESQDTNAAGYEMVCVQLGETAVSFNTYAAMPYVITQNTVSEQKSMELLNLMYTDAEIMNLMSYGVEGIHYRKTEDGYFTYVDEEKRNPFINNAWKVPNQFITGVWEGNPLTLWEDMRKFNEEAIQSCEIGFNFDISPVMTEYFALSDIYSKYKNVLENGLVNPEEGLEAMLEEMYDSGLSDVLAEETRQFEDWKARTDR